MSFYLDLFDFLHGYFNIWRHSFLLLLICGLSNVEGVSCVHFWTGARQKSTQRLIYLIHGRPCQDGAAPAYNQCIVPTVQPFSVGHLLFMFYVLRTIYRRWGEIDVNISVGIIDPLPFPL